MKRLITNILLGFVIFTVALAGAIFSNQPTSHGVVGLEQVWQINAVRTGGSDGGLELHYFDGSGNEISTETITVSSTDKGILGFTASMPNQTKGILAYCRTAAVSIGFSGTLDTSVSANYVNASPTTPINLAVGQPFAFGFVPRGVWNAAVNAYAQTSSSATVTLPNTTPTLQIASLTVSSSGDNTIVAAVSAKKIYVVAYTIAPTAAVNVTWKDDTAGATMEGPIDLSGIGNGIIRNVVANPSGGWVQQLPTQTTVNKPLVLNLSGAVSVSVFVIYYTA